MYKPGKGPAGPPPPAQNYGTVNNQGNNYGNTQDNRNNYDLPNYDKNSSRGNSGINNPSNGALYDEFNFNEFSSTKIRHQFIRKVYILLTLQLLFTFGLSLLAVLNQPVKDFVLKYNLVFFICGFILTFTTLIIMACFPIVARKYPWNYFMLAIVTIGMTCLVAVASAATDSNAFFYALATTAVVTIGLTLFSFQTKYDFTGWIVYVYVIFLILLVATIIGIFFRNKIFHLVIACVTAFLLCICIVIDTQMIVGGKHKKYQFSIDDYIFATLALYMDIVNLFLSILSIISSTTD